MKFSTGLFASSAFLFACGGSNPPPAPVAPAPKPIATNAPPPVDTSAVPEPANLVVVARVTKPEAIAKTVGGWTGLPLPSATELVKGITDDAIGDSVDLSQPVDAAVSLGGSKLSPKPMWAFSVAVKSFDAAKARISAKHRMTASTNGAFKIEDVGKGGAVGGENDDDDDDLDCVLAPAAENKARMVCGDPSSLEALVPYLTRTLPRKSFPSDLHIEVRMAPVRALANDLRMQIPLLARTLLGSQSPAVRELVDAGIGEAFDFVADTNLVTLDGQFADSGIEASLRAEYGSAKSLIAQLATTSVDRAGPPPAAFWHVPQDADVVLFGKGSDPKLFAHPREILSNLVLEGFTEGGMPESEKKILKDLIANRMFPYFTGPAVYAKGFDAAALDKAIAARKAVKKTDLLAIDEADKTIGEQVIGWHLFQVGEPVVNVGAMLKEWSALWTRPGFAAWAKKQSSAKMLARLRIAPTPAGLPKDSVHLEITIPREDIEDTNAAPQLQRSKDGKASGLKKKMIARKPIVAHVIAVPDAGTTWLAFGLDASLLAKKAAVALSSAPDTNTLGKASGYDVVRAQQKINGALAISMKGLLVFTAGGRQDSPYSALNALPNKGMAPAVMTFAAQGPSQSESARAGAAVSTLRIPRGMIEDVARLMMTR